jgi:trans-feruloyl-CoA hydratase/vanillin synthase
MAKYCYSNVKVEIGDGIGWAMLDRPDKRNAMSPALHEEMDDALARLEFDPDAKVVVVAGVDGHFSAGQDLKKFFRELENDPAGMKRAREVSNRWRWDRLFTFEKPTIAMVQGHCIGGAFMQLLGCDFAIAADDANFCLSEINWGNLPASLVAKVVSDAILPRHALYYACVGESFDGREAARIGLVNSSVPAERLRTAVEELARKLMTKDPQALLVTRRAMRQVRSMDVDQAYDYLMDKTNLLRARKSGSYATGLSKFLDDKSYKPAQAAYGETRG